MVQLPPPLLPPPPLLVGVVVTVATVVNNVVVFFLARVVYFVPSPRGNAVEFSRVASVGADWFVSGSCFVASEHREWSDWQGVQGVFDGSRPRRVVGKPSSFDL